VTAYYPIFVDLDQRTCVVIGGDAMAEAKVAALLEAGASITVISETVTARLSELARERRITINLRSYRTGDLEGAWLAVTTGEGGTSNRAVWAEAESRRILLNAVDDLPNCSFIAPAIFRQGDLTVAISTGGKSPALAVRLRDRIASSMGPEYATFLSLLGDLRSEIKRRIPGYRPRSALWYRIVDSDILDHVRRRDLDGARRRAAQLVQEEAERSGRQ
jgi:siroheme synthase-like protein